MKKWLACGAALCLLLSGCGAQEQITAKTEAAEDGQWRDVYQQFLSDQCEQESARQISEEETNGPDGCSRYFLSDMNGDGVPELFLTQVGGYDVYTVRDGTAIKLGEIPWYYSLYSDPDGDGVVALSGTSGCGYVHRLTFGEGGVLQETLLYEKTDPNVPGVDAEEVVSGSMYLLPVRISLGQSEGSGADRAKPLTLPIEEYGKERVRQAEDAASSAKARAAIEAVLEQGGTFYGVSADGDGGDTGETTWEAYLTIGDGSADTAVPQKLEKLAWTDVNGDGQVECVAALLDGEQRPDRTVVFCEQEGTVYAYCLNWLGGCEVDADGVFWDRQWENEASTVGLSFQNEQCYLHPARRNAAAKAVTWIMQ